MASATGFMAIITYIMVLLFPFAADDQSFFAAFPKFSLIVAVSLISYIIICRLFKLPEVNPILDKVKKIFFKQPTVSE